MFFVTTWQTQISNSGFAVQQAYLYLRYISAIVTTHDYRIYAIIYAPSTHKTVIWSLLPKPEPGALSTDLRTCIYRLIKYDIFMYLSN
jgi:hypothetical protein